MLIVVIIGITGCMNSNDRLENSVLKQWVGKEMSFSDLVFTIKGKDTIYFNTKNFEYLIFSYVDYSDCISCKLRLYAWKELINEYEDRFPHRIGFVLYYCPKSPKDIIYFLEKEDFEYPICIDTTNKMDSIFNFPIQFQFQTYLIKNNKVIGVGNPIFNPQVKALYDSILMDKKNE